MQQQAFIALKFPSKHTSTGADIIEKNYKKQELKNSVKLKIKVTKYFYRLWFLRM